MDLMNMLSIRSLTCGCELVHMIIYAPSDLSGIGGMHRERIRALSSWRGEGPRYDCIFINTDPTQNGMRGLEVTRVRSFFPFKFRNILYPCALVRWHSHNDDGPDKDMGMGVVEPDSHPDGSAFTAVIHLDSILHAAHLIPVFGKDAIPTHIPLGYSLDVFNSHASVFTQNLFWDLYNVVQHCATIKRQQVGNGTSYV